MVLTPLTNSSAWLWSAAVVALLAGTPPRVDAQKRKPGPEFTTQVLLVPQFGAGQGTSWRYGMRAADAVRSRVGKFVNRREVDVLSKDRMEIELAKASFVQDTGFRPEFIHHLAKFLRADEYIMASVANGGGAVRISATLLLTRDSRLRQPLPVAVAARLDDAADTLARLIAVARAQLTAQRRCENALARGNASVAMDAARQAVTAYPRSTIARTCLLWAMKAAGTPHAQVLAVAKDVLATDSTSAHALQVAAMALDSLRRPAESAGYWLRLAQTDTTDLKLAEMVVEMLVAGGSTRRAEPFIIDVSEKHPDALSLLRQRWHVTFANKSWQQAVDAGELLLTNDSSAARDSVLYARLAAAYQSLGRPYRALELLAHGVAAFPGDARLYALYAQGIKQESDTVVRRGLGQFPSSGQLLALNAKELKSRGRLEESLDATKRAVELDTTIAQGQLMVAQAEIELGRPDSALASVRRALERGEDTAMVAQFTLSKGNTLYRAASGTNGSRDFALALRYLSLADTLRSSPQSRFLIGAAALGFARSALAEASTLPDKAEGCRRAQQGAEAIPMARSGLEAGAEIAADAVRQSLAYLVELEPYALKTVSVLCGNP
jgi:tetratricopeptide (TPR) repeat protein